MHDEYVMEKWERLGNKVWVFYYFFILFCVGRLQGWKVDMEELGNEQD